MAQHEWVRLRLDNWASWLERSERGTLGYPRQATFAKWQPSSSDGAHVPVNDVQARATDDAINALRYVRPRWFLVLHLRWAGDPRLPLRERGGPLTVEGTAIALCVAASTVYALQAQAIEHLALTLPRY